jgi:hypothetical protein
MYKLFAYDTISDLFENAESNMALVNLFYAEDIKNIGQYVQKWFDVHNFINVYENMIRDYNLPCDHNQLHLKLIDLRYLRDRYFYDGAEQKYIKNDADKQYFLINKHEFDVNK